MILVDTSAWIEYLRGSDHPVTSRLTDLIERGVPLTITEPIVMELLAGATTPRLEQSVGRLVDGLRVTPVDSLLDYRAAAQLHVASRRNGHPIRSLMDCLIAAVAIRRGIAVLHGDRDFDYLAEISPLQVHGIS
ncbi:PIN domain nuclease [Microbacterium koreense]|uniref:Ribonuclease VapC n=1 Tax=Microbacterium koreense TaxID=323761 RepID=A0ABW2ZP02_9MICO